MRGNSAARGYDRRWRNARAQYLRGKLCAYCLRQGRERIATLVDHVVPHRGDRALFWDRDNWQPLCKPCHDAVKQREERTGRREGCDVNGLPLDQGHPWNQPERE
jgi:5-methylcytosine-specific restriction endonuclease McrA